MPHKRSPPVINQGGSPTIKERNRAIKMLARSIYTGDWRYLPKPTWIDYLNINIRPSCIKHVVINENGDSWSCRWLLDAKTYGVKSDEEIIYELDAEPYHNGPGRGFTHKPRIESSKYSILVSQIGGLDV